MDEIRNDVVETTVDTCEACEPVEKERPDYGGYAMLGLAGVGTLFLAKKAFDLGKKGYGKAKEWFASKKAAKANATAETEAKVETEEKSEE